MTGITLDIELPTSEFRQALGRTITRLDQPRGFHKQVGEHVHGTTLERARREVSPEAVPWEKLRPSTKRHRIRKGKSPLGILRMKGDLMNSINYQLIADGVKISANGPYAAIHQFGGEIERAARTQSIFRKRCKDGSFDARFRKRTLKTSVETTHAVAAHSIHIPARPYLGVSEEDRERIKDMARA